jgi:hypothetical protein
MLLLLTATTVAVSILAIFHDDRKLESRSTEVLATGETGEVLPNFSSNRNVELSKLTAAEGLPPPASSVPPIVAAESTSDTGMDSLERREFAASDYAGLLEGDDSPPWPKGTEDSILQAIAQHSRDIEITGIQSGECAGHLCVILFSIPDLNPSDTTDYENIAKSLRDSNLEIGGTSIGFVDASPGVRLLRLAIDNIEWTDERLHQVREAAAKKSKLPDENLGADR